MTGITSETKVLTLSIDPNTNEPFLRLPPPHQNIILTPPRSSDVPTITTNMQDPKVYKTLEGPPFPYKEEDAVWWINQVKPVCDKAWEEIQTKVKSKKEGEDTAMVFGDCPVRIIREVQSDGTQVMLGDCGVSKWGYEDVMDLEERKRQEGENENREVGDPDTIWMIGDYIASSHHGKGIMSSVLRTILKEWVIPHMNVHRIRSFAFKDNIGSLRVFEKNGFVVEKTIARYFVDKRGLEKEIEIGITLVDWKRENFKT